MLDFDDMLIQVGEFGLYQKTLFIFQAPFCIFVTFVLFGQLFMTLYPMNFWCADHFNCIKGDSVISQFQRQNLSFSWTSGAVNPCYMNNIDRNFIEMVFRQVTGSCGQQRFCHYNETELGVRKSFVSDFPLLPQSFKYRGWSSGTGFYGSAYPPGRKPSTTSGVNRPPDQPNENYRPEIQFPESPPNKQFPTRKPTSNSPTRPNKGGISGGNGFRPSQGGLLSPENLPYFNNKSSCAGNYLDVSMSNESRIVLFTVRSRKPSKAQMNRTFVDYRKPAYVNVKHCKKIDWDRERSGVPYDTVVTEGNWWCNAEIYIVASQSLFYCGAIVGGFLLGYIADSYGRVPALVLANIFGAVGGALSVVSSNFWYFMIFRFITGMAFDNCFTMMYILVLEFCGPTYRTLIANLSIAIFYTTGTILLPILAFYLQNWQIYGLVISLPMFLGLFAIFLVPESARWLLSKGRAVDATNILRSFAKVNRKNVNERIFVEFESEARKLYDEIQAEDEESSFTAALKTPRLRRTFILLTLIWSLIALVYDGHSRNILNLANEEWNVFWMFGIASMTEFPADMLLIFTLDRFGRRWLSFGSLTLSGAASVIAATITSPEMRTVGLVLAIVSRFFVNVAFNIGLQYAAELLPTVIRAQGVNAIHIIGYVASILSPLIAAIGRTQPAISLILLGAFAITGGCLSLFLAETLGEELPNTLEEAENFGKHQSFWNCPICSGRDVDQEIMEVPEPEVVEAVRRNNLRSTIRGETYRSSIISSRSGGSRSSRLIGLNPSLSPAPEKATETTRLKRFTH